MAQNRMVEFSYKVNKEDQNPKTLKVTLDLSDLSEEDILQYAEAAMVIDLQRRLRSGAVKEKSASEDGKTFDLQRDGYKVPRPGTRGKKPVEDKLADFCKKNGISAEALEAFMKQMGK